MNHSNFVKHILERLIKLRNPKFEFDSSVQTGVILKYFWVQFASLLRGIVIVFRMRNPKYALIGKGVKILNLAGLSFGRYLKLGNYVSMSALGRGKIIIGDNVSIGDYCRIIISTSFNNIGESISIGDNVGIGEFSYLGGGGGLKIGSDCIVGQYFSCHPENHNYGAPNILIRNQGVTRQGISIGDNCWIGSKVTVLDNVTIGSGCIIAAGSVVTKSFTTNCVIGGVPAKYIKSRF